VTAEESVKLRARIHLRMKYREYLWHSTVAHAAGSEAIRDRREALAQQSRWEARSCYWIITGKQALPLRAC
jgi:hypothetical protein